MRIALLTLLALSACTGYGVAHSEVPALDPFAPPPEGFAHVCVFRASTIGAALTTPVRDNGLVVGATEGPGYFCYRAGPGLHTLSVEVSDARPIQLVVGPGEHRFVEHRLHIGQDALLPLDPARARELAAHLDYAVIAEHPPDEPPVETVPTVPGLPVHAAHR